MKNKPTQKPLLCSLIISLLLPLWLLHIAATGIAVGLDNQFDLQKITQKKSSDNTKEANKSGKQAQYNYLQTVHLGLQSIPDLAGKIISDFLLAQNYLWLPTQNNFQTKPSCTNNFVHTYKRILFLTLILAKGP